MTLRVTGAEQLRLVSVDLKAAPRFQRTRLRRNILTATAPITTEAKTEWQGTYGHLGEALAAATRTQVLASGPRVGVAVRTDGSKLPAGKQTLPPLVEGFRPWRHKRWGQPPWYPQAPHPELGPAVKRHLPGVQVAVIEAVEATAEAIAHGGV